MSHRRLNGVENGNTDTTTTTTRHISDTTWQQQPIYNDDAAYLAANIQVAAIAAMTDIDEPQQCVALLRNTVDHARDKQRYHRGYMEKQYQIQQQQLAEVQSILS